MVSRALIIFAALFAALPAAAVGFFQIHDARIPLPVKIASQSVYSIIVLAESDSLYTEHLTFQLEKKFAELSAQPTTQARRVAQVIKLYLERCKAADQALCRVPGKAGATGAGSAVLIGASGRELWSAGHVFEKPFQEALKSHGFKNVQDIAYRRHPFKVLVFDGQDRLIAHPFNNELRLVYSASSEVVRMSDPEVNRDHVRLEFLNPIGRGLEVAPSQRTGAKVYSVGYPACTGCAKEYANPRDLLLSGTRSPFRDASQFDLQVTVGTILTQDMNIVVTDADAHQGMSGGAALDEEGRVIGINAAVDVKKPAPLNFAERRLKISRPSGWLSQPSRT